MSPMNQTDAKISGKCDPKFFWVREVFENLFEEGKELGAGVAVSIDGKLVVDLWGGYADTERARCWEKDTLVNVYSTTKGMTAACVHRLVDQGKLDPDRKVSRYWPEFGCNGKEDIRLRHLLSHQAGLPAIDAPLPPEAIFDWGTMTGALAEQAPLWKPGTQHGYHARTFGWLLGEVVRRISGKSLGAYFKDEIAGPLGLDFYIGLPDEHHARVAAITAVPPPPPGTEPNLARVMQIRPQSFTARAFMNPPSYRIRDVANTPQWRRAELPSSNGHGTANAVARFYGALACKGTIDGIRVLGPESIECARTEQARGPDQVLIVETRFGHGFMMPVAGAEMGPNDKAFGHPGMGGSLGFADPEAGVGFGYVMNLAGSFILIDERPIALVTALYDCLG
ncbi:Putative esterase [Olavius algarvensis Delta 1 endosymbiont]|nr:Putative esterase [Olavius algarvensis Delta 1 endosymbiont]